MSSVAIRAARRTAVVPRGGAFRAVEASALVPMLIPMPPTHAALARLGGSAVRPLP